MVRNVARHFEVTVMKNHMSISYYVGSLVRDAELVDHDGKQYGRATLTSGGVLVDFSCPSNLVPHLTQGKTVHVKGIGIPKALGNGTVVIKLKRSSIEFNGFNDLVFTGYAHFKGEKTINGQTKFAYSVNRPYGKKDTDGKRPSNWVNVLADEFIGGEDKGVAATFLGQPNVSAYKDIDNNPIASQGMFARAVSVSGAPKKQEEKTVPQTPTDADAEALAMAEAAAGDQLPF